MKKNIALLIICGAASMLCAGVQAKEKKELPSLNSVSYALPRTVLMVEATIKQTTYKAGPYAEFAEGMLNVDAILENRVTTEIASIRVTSYTEADPERRYNIFLEDTGNLPRPLYLGTYGITSAKTSSPKAAEWSGRPGAQDASLKDAAVAQSAIYNVNFDSAAQCAELIFRYRDLRYKILSGDTDATYSGDAMRATIDELLRMERECTVLFTGTVESQTYKTEYLVIPAAGETEQSFILAGIGDDSIVMDIVAEEIDMPLQQSTTTSADATVQEIVSLVAAPCTVSFNYSVGGEIFSTRVPVYQMGQEIRYPVVTKTKNK